MDYARNSCHALSSQNTMQHLLLHATHVRRILARQSLKHCGHGQVIMRPQRYTGSTGWLGLVKQQSLTHSVKSLMKMDPLLVPSLLISGLIPVMFVASFPPSVFSWLPVGIFPLSPISSWMLWKPKPDCKSWGIVKQFLSFIVRPLTAAYRTTRGVVVPVIVLDALDECSDPWWPSCFL